MKTLFHDRRNFLSKASLSLFATLAGQRALGVPLAPSAPAKTRSPLLHDVEIYQQGPDRQASWAYVGFLPRMQDPNRIAIVASFSGCSVRVSMTMTHDEVANYANYLVRKAEEMELVRTGISFAQWDNGSYSTPFDVLDVGIYTRFLQTIQTRVKPIVGAGYRANLQLLKEFFPMSVFEREEQVEFHIVFPATPPASGPTRARPSDTYTIYSFEERRTYYSVEGSHIFAGFPALWFNGEVGFHGPIRYVTAKNDLSKLNGRLSDTGEGPDGKQVDKRWQLHRRFESHGCFRMEHILALRHMLPADANGTSKIQPRAQRVRITLLRDFDEFDINGDGRDEIMGVHYYWIQHSQAPNEAKWKSMFYKNVDPSLLYEFPYTDPSVAQIVPTTGSNGRANSLTTMARLNRMPYSDNG